MATRIDIPACAGDYEECITCNGDCDSSDEEERAPCSFRDRCAAFKLFLTARNKTPSEYLKKVKGSDFAEAIKGYEHFLAMCDAQISNYGVEYGIATIDYKPPVIRKKKAGIVGYSKTKRKRRMASAIKKRNKAMLELLEHFKMHFVESLVTRKMAKPKKALLIGEIYMVNNFETGDKCKIYCKGYAKSSKLIAVVKKRKKNGTLCVYYPIENTSFSGVGKATMEKLNPKPYRHYKNMKSSCDNLDSEGTALAAQTLAYLIETNKIELPEIFPLKIYK